MPWHRYLAHFVHAFYSSWFLLISSLWPAHYSTTTLLVLSSIIQHNNFTEWQISLRKHSSLIIHPVDLLHRCSETVICTVQSHAQCNVMLSRTVQTKGHHGVGGVGMVEAVVATSLIWKTSRAFEHSKFPIHSWTLQEAILSWLATL